MSAGENTGKLIKRLNEGDRRALSRCISIVENDLPGFEAILEGLKHHQPAAVIGVTGPAGAGKSTLINALIGQLTAAEKDKKAGVIAIDPTSPFTGGSVLADRIRMTGHFSNANVFIRSLATRGWLGGISAKTIEVYDLMNACGFDYIFIETTGAGQSEVDIAGLADTTLLLWTAGSGDEIQTLKSGILEIADIFVVNKAAKGGAEAMVKNLLGLISRRNSGGWSPPVIKTDSLNGEGIHEIIAKIKEHQASEKNCGKTDLLACKAYRLIQHRRMKNIDLNRLREKITEASGKSDFNLYRFIKELDP